MKTYLLAIVAVVMAGCSTATQHRQAVDDPTRTELSVGTVQKEIHVGMSGAEVAAVLGTPNIVTTDEARREAWIYDRVSTTYAYSKSEAGLGALILGWTGSVAGAVGPGYNSASGATSQTQRTLTVIIKFDDAGHVRDFAYHTSKF